MPISLEEKISRLEAVNNDPIQYIHDHGEIELIDIMGSDVDIEDAARVSHKFDPHIRKRSSTEGLLRYLLRHKHTTPFEMAVLKFRIKAPIFVARQWIRHRMSSTNEISGRYSVLRDEFWMPDDWMTQSENNKQGRSDEIAEYRPMPTHCSTGDDFVEQEAFDEYNRRIEAGVSREMARSCLPLSTYTEWYWKIDLHNLMHFLQLRMDSHAQKETRDYAEIIADAVRRFFPMSWRAFEDYRLDSIHLSGPEIRSLKHWVERTKIKSKKKPSADDTNQYLGARERKEFTDKLQKMGLS